MEDGKIIGLFFAREEQALDETKKKYGNYCFTVANGILGCAVDVYGDNTAEIRETELGGVEGLLISVPEDPLYPKHHFYWEDGEYVFYMIFPYYVTEAEMAEIISSIHVVEDIRPYLISYCESEEYLNELLN